MAIDVEDVADYIQEAMRKHSETRDTHELNYATVRRGENGRMVVLTSNVQIFRIKITEQEI